MHFKSLSFIHSFISNALDYWHRTGRDHRNRTELVIILDEAPKRHILAWFRAFWALDHADPFTAFFLQTIRRNRELQQVTEKLYFTCSRGILHQT